MSAVLLTVGCYGFAYTGAIERGFAMAQMLSVAVGWQVYEITKRPLDLGYVGQKGTALPSGRV